MLHGAKLDGAKHFQKNCQNVPGAAGAAVGAAAGAAAASAVCIYYVTRVPSYNARKSMKLPERAAYKKYLRGTFEYIVLKELP